MAFRFPDPSFPNEAEPTCNLLFIRRRLGREDYTLGRMASYVTRLIAQRGFPPPYPQMSQRRAELIDRVTVNSTWPRAAVEQWLTDFLPPDTAAGLDAAAMQAAAADMDQAAANLGGRDLRSREGLKLVGGTDV